MTAPAIVGAGYAECSWGRWVIRCARPWCFSALTLGPDLRAGDSPDGYVVRRGLRWGDAAMECWDCGYVTGPLHWPVDPAAIEMLLGRRPDIRTRNWLPGETLNDLLGENIAHGLIPTEAIDADERLVLMTTRDDFLTGGVLLDALPAAAARRAITGGQ